MIYVTIVSLSIVILQAMNGFGFKKTYTCEICDKPFTSHSHLTCRKIPKEKTTPVDVSYVTSHSFCTVILKAMKGLTRDRTLYM